MRYRDPVTGASHSQSTGTKNRRKAERVAAKWEAELQAGRYQAPNHTSWLEFRDRVDDDYVPTLAPKSIEKVWCVLDSFEKTIAPKKMNAITNESVAVWQRNLRKRKLAEATIKSYSATLKAAFRWAASMDLLAKALKVTISKRGRSSHRETPMKGRALTPAEFELLTAVVPNVIGTKAAPSWQYLLRGLWLSGLRLGEALSLSWDNEDELRVQSGGRHTMLSIPGDRQKSRRDQLLPITPDFAKFLEAVPDNDRTGHVFPLVWRRPAKRRIGSVSTVIGAIGREAGIIVSNRNGKTKYASAHDLRRSFGDRWAAQVTSLTLMKLMRHESIETTERFYATRQAEVVMDELSRLPKG